MAALIQPVVRIRVSDLDTDDSHSICANAGKKLFRVPGEITNTTWSKLERADRHSFPRLSSKFDGFGNSVHTDITIVQSLIFKKKVLESVRERMKKIEKGRSSQSLLSASTQVSSHADTVRTRSSLLRSLGRNLPAQ